MHKQQREPRTLPTIIVTGNRGMPRTAPKSLQPIDVLSAADLASTGATNLLDALQTLLPTFNFPEPAMAGTTSASMPAQLRGLAPDDTLVLIDGKRQHATAMVNTSTALGRGSSPVDLSAIPINAIERVEVLQDGAAAQYGSDAIAGVINIILKGGNRHGAASLTRSLYGAGDGSTWQGDVDGGLPLGTRGWLHLSATALHQDPTNRANPDFRFPGDPTYGTVTFQSGLPLDRSQQAAANLQYPLGTHTQLYGFGIFSHRDVAVPRFFESLSQYREISPPAVAAFPDGFLPVQDNVIRDRTAVLGLRGRAFGWHYDLSVDTGGNRWNQRATHTFNFSLGSASPTTFALGALAAAETVWNAGFRRPVDLGWLTSPATLAWGLEYRHQSFTIDAGVPASYTGVGANQYPGFEPQDAGRHARHDLAAYVDLSGAVTRKLSLDFAARHERYSDSGDNISWKLAARYALSQAFAVRGTASTGFRAPSLQQEFYADTTSAFVPQSNGTNLLLPVRTFPVDAPAAIALGARPLNPETSHNYSLGVVLTPPNGLYATLDAYQITVDDRILLSDDLVGAAVGQYLATAGFPFLDGGDFFTNAANTRTRGADLMAVDTFSLPRAGSIRLTGGADYNRTDIRSVRPNPPQLALAGLVLPILGRDQAGLITAATPRTNSFVDAQWITRRWTLDGRLLRYGHFAAVGLTPAGDQTYNPRYLLDLSASYHSRPWVFTLGANDVTNAYPEKLSPALSFDGIFNYTLLSPFGHNGVEYYARVAVGW